MVDLNELMAAISDVDASTRYVMDGIKEGMWPFRSNVDLILEHDWDYRKQILLIVIPVLDDPVRIETPMDDWNVSSDAQLAEAMAKQAFMKLRYRETIPRESHLVLGDE